MKSFIWKPEGAVEIKAFSFEIIYDKELKGFKQLKNYENLQSSLLSWRRNEKEKYYCFELKDINCYNLRTGKTINNDSKQSFKFGVGINGRYVHIIKKI